jgi:hypothetical protein
LGVNDAGVNDAGVDGVGVDGASVASGGWEARDTNGDDGITSKSFCGGR